MVSPSFTDCPGNLSPPRSSQFQQLEPASLSCPDLMCPLAHTQTTSLDLAPCAFRRTPFLVPSSLPPSCSFTPSRKQVIVFRLYPWVEQVINI